MHGSEAVSETHQMYLKTLHRLCAEGGGAGRVRDLARELGITPGTVSSVVTRLQELGLVDRERYGSVSLTPAGAAVARCVLRRFETVRALLVDVLALDEETAEREACRMEHAVGPATVRRLAVLVDRIRDERALDRTSLARAMRNVRAGCEDCEASGMCLTSGSGR
jgi:DtxR family Mn-dependent transcriptional regulator